MNQNQAKNFPSPVQLLYCVALYEEGSHCAAAKRLGVAQSSLTVAIRRMETNIGKALFTTKCKGKFPESHPTDYMVDDYSVFICILNSLGQI